MCWENTMIDWTHLPDNPGCYLFRDAQKHTIYVGKAKNLRKRISSYSQRHDRDRKTARLVETIDSVDYIITDTEIEALILENTLIKKYQPKYNINLKDSKNYAYIQFSDAEFPRMGIARNSRGSGLFFGPFVSAKERDYVLSVLKRIFKLRSCRRLPKRPCLRYHIGSCSAPCIGAISKQDYREQVGRAEAVLRGDTRQLLATLQSEMAEKSAIREFEQAMELRDQIAAVKHLTERQHVDRQKSYNEDIINFIEQNGTVYLMLFNIHRGTLADKQEFVFEGQEEFLEEFLVQYYSEHEPPPEVILPRMVEGALADFLAIKRGRKVRIRIPKRGEKKKLLELVYKNIEITYFGGQRKLEELQKRLRLPDLPVIIEGFDISHLSGTAMVGSMVQFRLGKPDKRNYRRFKIRTVEEIDDFAALSEVVRRRYERLKREEGEFPDLIVVDGGRGQLNAARRELEKIGLKIPVIAIAKQDEEIYVPGLLHPLPINRKEKASLFVQEIRDEAHRFAITYNRLLRKKQMIS
jgi:excinuclease ABC subunit C